MLLAQVPEQTKTKPPKKKFNQFFFWVHKHFKWEMMKYGEKK